MGKSKVVDLKIENGKLVIPDNGVFEANLYIHEGKIHSYGSHNLEAKKTIDAKGNYVAPGIIDPHVHFGLFRPLKEELQSEGKGAIVGGVTTVGNFVGGPESHLKNLPEIIKDVENYSHIDMIPHLVIQTEEQLEEIPKYIKDFNVKSFKVYFNGLPGMIPSVSDGFILKVMDKIQRETEEGILCVHTENEAIVEDATAKMKEKYPEGNIDTKLWAETHPRIAEYEAVHRISSLAKYKEMQIYIVHLFTKLGVDALSQIRYDNPYVNVETTSPYLALNKEEGKDLLKMAPPFHGKEDQEALWQGIKRGVIDTIGTDNVTMTKEEKNLDNGNYWKIIEGYPATEHHLPVLLSEGVHKRNIPIEKLIATMTKNPAKKFGVYPQKGSFNIGADGDVVIIDLDLEKEVKLEETYSRSDFNLYEGKKLKGWPVATIKAGELVAKNGKILDTTPKGKLLKR